MCIYIYIYYLKRFKAACCLCCAVRAFCLLGSDLLSLQAGSRPVEPECHVGMTKCTVAKLVYTQGCVVLDTAPQLVELYVHHADTNVLFTC